MINRKEHLNTEGLRKIVEIKASINKGLTSTLIETYPNIISIKRPPVVLPSTIDLNFVVGFVDGVRRVVVLMSILQIQKHTLLDFK